MFPNSRSYTDPSYSHRYGFNGMLEDNELKGEGNSYSTLFREYDPRVGRFLSLDPSLAKYPNISPYVAFADNPVMFVDPDGEDYSVTVIHGKNPQIIIRANYIAIINESIDDATRFMQSGIRYWNDVSKKYQYTVNNIDYDIIFELDVQDNTYNFANDGPVNTITVSREGKAQEDVEQFWEDTGLPYNPAIKGANVRNTLFLIFEEVNKENNPMLSPHEFGHGLGMEHYDVIFNIMNSKEKSTQIDGTSVRSNVTANIIDMLGRAGLCPSAFVLTEESRSATPLIGQPLTQVNSHMNYLDFENVTIDGKETSIGVTPKNYVEIGTAPENFENGEFR